MKTLPRRTLLKAATVSIIPSTVLGSLAPSNRITLGVIGYGPRCTSVLGSMIAEPDLHVRAVCDVQSVRRDNGKRFVDGKYNNADCQTHVDFRDVLARPDIDAVLIATGDRWHAAASIMAARAGKDVYSEKPCAMTIADCLALLETIRRTGRVFQAGTQRRSIGNFQLAVQLARTGRLGKLQTLYASVYTPQDREDWLPAQPEPAKDVCDWDMWLGPAPWRPYNARYVQGGWRGFADFDSGATLLDWGAHTLDLCQWANDADHTTPVSYEPSDKNITCTYANGVKVILDFLKTPFGDRPGWHNHLGTCPVRFVGDQGWVETGDAGGLEASSPDLKAELNKLRLYATMAGTTAASHGRNFLDCVKSRGKTAANEQVMLHSHTACHAAALSWTLKQNLTFDPGTFTFPASPEANRMRSKAHREPWRL